MKKILGVSPVELVIFLVFAAVYVGFQLWWTIMVALNPGGVIPFLAAMNPVAANNRTLLLAVVVCSLVYTVVVTVAVKGSGEGNEKPKPVAVFLIRLGLALSFLPTIGQLVALFVPAAGWKLPAQGIPILYVYTLAAAVGIALAGIGSNMIWVGDKREQFLATTATKKK